MEITKFLNQQNGVVAFEMSERGNLDAILEHSKGHFPKKKDPGEIRGMIEKAINNGKFITTNRGGNRCAFVNEAQGIVLVFDGSANKTGTIFRPDNFKKWVQDFKNGKK